MNQKSVILLIKDQQYEFFGSLASLFDKHDACELGITQQGLNNYFYRLRKELPYYYKNDLCTIVKGKIYSAPSTRGRKPINESET